MTAKPKTLLPTTWTWLLLASGSPRIIVQEVVHSQLSADMGVAIGSITLGGQIQ